MLAKTCQIATRYPGISCNQQSAGFLLRADETASAVYREGFVLCKGHGLALEDEEGNGDYTRIGEVADLMNDEERRAQSAPPEDTDMSTTAVAPVMNQHARIDLGQLAVMVNSRTADTRPVVEPRVIAVPRAADEPAPDVHDLGRVKTAEEMEEEELKAQMAALKAKLDATKRARIEREKAEAEATKAAKAAERAAKELEQNGAYQFTQAAQLRTYLMLHGGSGTLQAVETLIEVGVLTVKSGALVVRNGAGTTRAPRESTVGATETPAAPREKDPEYEAKKAQYKVLRAEGKSLTDIAALLGVSNGTVSGWSTRYPVVVQRDAAVA